MIPPAVRPDSGPAPATASRKGESPPATAAPKHFVRLEWGYRRNLNSPPLPQILKSFSVESNGDKVRVTDGDGSVYEGTNLESKKSGEGRSSQMFRVEGRSLRLKASIRFEAEMIRDAAGERIQGRVHLAGKDQFPLSASRLPP